MGARRHNIYLRVFNYEVLSNFRTFSEDWRRFSKIHGILSEVGSTEFSVHFPKINEDFRGRSEGDSIVDQHLIARVTFNKGKHSS